jgi:hypothetical protein
VPVQVGSKVQALLRQKCASGALHRESRIARVTSPL